MSTVQKGPLPLHSLKQLEFQFARSRRRTDFWPAGMPRAAAIGRLLRELMKHRADDSDSTREIRPVTAQDLVAVAKSIPTEDFAVEPKLSQTKLSSLLNGNAIGTDPFTNKLGAALLRTILFGSLENRSLGDDPSSEVGERITNFFFPISPAGKDRPGFFDEAYKGRSEPATTVEAISEIYALIFAMESARESGALDSSARIVRTSGNKRFVQVNHESELTASGVATLRALEAGVEVWFAFPKKTEAESTFECFREKAKDHIDYPSLKRLKSMKLGHSKSKTLNGVKYWSGDFLSRPLRFVYHEFQPSREDTTPSWKNLLISRSPRYGPTVWNPSEDEISDFSSWFSALNGGR